MARIIFETKSSEEREAKKKERQEWVNQKVNTIEQAIVENPELAVSVASAVAIGVTTVVKTISRLHGMHEAQELKDNYIYDNRLGKYWHLRRPLRNSEALELERRRDLGEGMGQILNDMRVLK